MDVAQSLVNYGALGICLAYFIWKDNTTMKDFRDSLDKFTTLLTTMKAEIDERNLENKGK